MACDTRTCNASIEDSFNWLTTALQNRLTAAHNSRNSHTGKTVELTSDLCDWLNILRSTVYDYEDQKQNRNKKVSCDSSVSTNSFEYIDKDIIENDRIIRVVGDSDDDDVASSVFDDILCDLGNEIFQLEAYHKKYFQSRKNSDWDNEFEQNVMNVFDEFLDKTVRSSTPLQEDDVSMKSIDDLNDDKSVKIENMDLKVPVISKVASFGNISALSDEVFLKSANSSRNGSNANLYVQCDSGDDVIIKRNLSNSVVDQTKHSSFDVNRIFDKGSGAPVPPKRKNRLSTPTQMENTELSVPVKKPVPKPRTFININDQRVKLDSDETHRSISQKSTSRYKTTRHKNADSDSGNNSPSSDYSDYQNLWNCTSGGKEKLVNKDNIKENYAVVNVIRYDSFKEMPKPNRQRILVCGPHGKADKGAESEGVVRNSRSNNHDKNKRYSYDVSKKREDIVSTNFIKNTDMVRCISDCDITDECHTSLAEFRANIMQYKQEDDVKSVSSYKTPMSECSVKSCSYQNLPEVLVNRGYQDAVDNVSDIVDNNSSVYDTDCGNCTTAATTTEEEWESSAEILSDCDYFDAPNNSKSNHHHINKVIINSKRSVSESTDCASESPIYENVRDLVKVKPVPDDVLAWKALLFSVDWMEDEEDEWATKEQADIYSRDCQPNGYSAPFTGYVIPRVKPVNSSKKHRREDHHHGHHHYSGEDSPEQDDWSLERSHNNSGEHQGSVKDKAKLYEKKGMIIAPGDQNRLKDRLVGSSPPIQSYRIQDPRLHPNIEFRTSSNYDTSRSQRVKSLGAVKSERLNLSVKNILHCGNVRVVKKAENGVKIPKQWHDNFLILKSDRLEFFDSEKAWRDNHLHRFDIVLKDGLIDLENVKKRIKIVDAKHDMYVTEHHNEREAKEWMTIIRNNALVVASDSQPSPSASLSPLMGRHRTKSTSKAASDESVNDIPSAGDSQENIPKNTKTSKLLDKWLRKRPQKDTLINKGIYQDEAVFGRNLWEVCPPERPRIPEFVVRCVRLIESNIQNMTADGIYRASGNLSQIQKIRLDVNQKNLSVVNDTVDIHVLTGALKLFFRELKEPLIPYEFFQRALNASCKQDHDTRIKEFRDIVRKLPECNKDTLTFFLGHLVNVTKYEDKNRMKVSNLAIVLGPTILWAPPNANQNLAIDFLKQNEVIECLLNDFKYIFYDEIFDKRDQKKIDTKM